MPGQKPVDPPVRFFGAATQAANDNKDASDQTQIDLGGPGTEPFWDATPLPSIQANWNKLFPYQLLILEKKGRTYGLKDIVARYTLPIPPEGMTITTPFAITTAVTLGGVIEEHNGAPIRDISLTGTTGVLPLRGTVVRGADLTSGVGTVFAGIVSGLNKVVSAVKELGPGTVPNTIDEAEFDGDAGKATGFYQFQLLQRFLEAYVARKRTGAGRDLRLALAVWRENEVYLVSPVRLLKRRAAPQALETTYTLDLRAWRRLNLSDQSGAAEYSGTPGTRSPNKFAQVVNRLVSARKVLEGARHVLEGLRADVQQVLLTPLRQMELFVADAAGLSITAAQLPADIIRDLKQPILEVAATRSGVERLSRRGTWGAADPSAAVQSLTEAFRQLAVSSGKADTESGTTQALAGQTTRDAAHPANKAIDEPAKHHEFFSQLKISDLNLRPEVLRKIEEERARARRFRRKDYQNQRDVTLELAARLEATIGAGSATYNKMFGPQNITPRQATDADWDTIDALNNLAQTLDTMAATSDTHASVNAIDYVAGFARKAGLAFNVPRSKFAVPFPYGYTMERLADKYLKEPDRWVEIATLNGLRAPYVDEEGFTLALLAPGHAQTVTVSSDLRLYVGQQVWLSSQTVRRETRRIQNIRKLGSTMLVTVDGEPDLNRFTVNSGAALQAFLPDTVNSQQLIYIPSDQAGNVQLDAQQAIPGVDLLDPLVRTGGVDLLLTPTGDLVFTANGDNRLAVGMTNIIQRVRLALGTPRGSLLHHPTYGIGLRAGMSTADLSAKDILTSMRGFFRDDPGISDISNAAVSKVGNSVFVRLSVGLAATGTYIPVQTEIRR